MEKNEFEKGINFTAGGCLGIFIIFGLLIVIGDALYKAEQIIQGPHRKLFLTILIVAAILFLGRKRIFKGG